MGDGWELMGWRFHRWEEEVGGGKGRRGVEVRGRASEGEGKGEGEERAGMRGRRTGEGRGERQKRRTGKRGGGAAREYRPAAIVL